jgi:penicillin-binding protein 1A
MAKKVYPEKEAAVMVDILQAVIEEGTGKRTKINGYPLAGKTGTTDNYRDALFVGFSPSVALGVWVGCDDSSSLGHLETGARAALPIWRDIMKYIAENRKYPEYFPVPDDIVYKKFDPDSGKIIDTAEKKGVIGIFIP